MDFKFKNMILALVIFTIIASAAFFANGSFNSYKNVDQSKELLTKNEIDKELILHGEWEYFPNEVIFPGAFYDRPQGQLVQVPYFMETNIEYATFRKIMEVSPDAELGLLNSEKNGDMNLFINKVYIEKDHRGPYYVKIQKTNTVEVVVHIKTSSQMKKFKGNMALASYKRIYSKHENYIRFQIATFLALMVLGFYYIIIYFFTGRANSLLFYSVFTLLLGIMVLFTGSRFIGDIFTSQKGMVQQYELLLGLLMFMVYSKFVGIIFEEEIKLKPWMENILWLIQCILMLTVLYREDLYHYTYIATGVVFALYAFIVIYKTSHLIFARKIHFYICMMSFYIIVWCVFTLFSRRFILYDMHFILIAGTISVLLQSMFFILELYRKLERANNIAEENKKILGEVQQFNQVLDQRITERTRELEELVKIDPLTNLKNHLTIINLLDETVNSQEGTTHIVMADLDNFKKVNDVHGHITGDSVIITASEIFSRQKEITFGRCGGEEFLGFTNTLTREEFIDKLELIRKELEETVFEDLNQKTFQVTVSGGISTYTGQDVTTLIKEADDRLYKAKSLGKNRICY